MTTEDKKNLESKVTGTTTVYPTEVMSFLDDVAKQLQLARDLKVEAMAPFPEGLTAIQAQQLDKGKDQIVKRFDVILANLEGKLSALSELHTITDEDVAKFVQLLVNLKKA